VRHARDANELLEVASDELRAIVGDDSRLGFQVLLLGSLQDHFDIGFSHRLTQIPMHEETTESIQNAAQVIEGAAQVDVGNVDMPVLMGLQRLLETGLCVYQTRSVLEQSAIVHSPNQYDSVVVWR
jgi:hypothetical protein